MHNRNSIKFIRGLSRRRLMNDKDDGAFLIMLSMLLGFILVFFAVLVYHTLRRWFCKTCCGRDVDEHQETVLVHDGQVFNLTGNQRRAVLETIFSESHKVKKAKLDLNIPVEIIDIPAAPSVGTDCSSDQDLGVDAAGASGTPTIKDQTDVFPEKASLSLAESRPSNLLTKTISTRDVMCRSTSNSSSSRFSPAIEKIVNNQHGTFTTTTFDDEISADGNICAICLESYNKEDFLVVSKYCTHCFHKDCILLWLEKHDECPCCRVGMVTDTDFSVAATSIASKTRMCQAVKSRTQAHIPRLSPEVGRSPGRTMRQAARYA